MGDLWGRPYYFAQEFDRLRRFVQIKIPAQHTVSTTAEITFWDTNAGYCNSYWPEIDYATPTVLASIGDSGTWHNCLIAHDNNNHRMKCRGCPTLPKFEFAVKNVAVVQVFQVIVACPTLTCLTLRFESSFGSSRWLDFDAFVTQVFSILRTSHSLSDLTLFVCGSYPQTQVEAITRFLSGNTQLKSCTMTVGYRPGKAPRDVSEFVHPLWTLLVPFSTTVPSEANLGIKRLVLESKGVDNGWIAGEYVDFGWKACEFDAVVDLVARNTTLEVLDAGYYRSRNQCGMGRALECNRTLKEIRFLIHSVADFEQLVVHLVPDANGHQANTTLSTLQLYLDRPLESPLDYLPDLAKLVAFNTTLIDVRIARELKFRDDSAQRKSLIQKTMVEVWKLRGELEKMVDNELRRNTSLRCLSVAEWEVHRGSSTEEWQMTYSGPCLARELGECGAECYEVKVKVR